MHKTTVEHVLCVTLSRYNSLLGLIQQSNGFVDNNKNIESHQLFSLSTMNHLIVWNIF